MILALSMLSERKGPKKWGLFTLETSLPHKFSQIAPSRRQIRMGITIYLYL